jgi:hypothetical protein
VSEGLQVPHQLEAGESESEAQDATSFAKNAAEYSFRKKFLFLDLLTSRSEIVGNRAVETATLAKLRRAYSDTAAVTQFINLVEQIHHVEAHDH